MSAPTRRPGPGELETGAGARTWPDPTDSEHAHSELGGSDAIGPGRRGGCRPLGRISGRGACAGPSTPLLIQVQQGLTVTHSGASFPGRRSSAAANPRPAAPPTPAQGRAHLIPGRMAGGPSQSTGLARTVRVAAKCVRAGSPKVLGLGRRRSRSRTAARKSAWPASAAEPAAARARAGRGGGLRCGDNPVSALLGRPGLGTALLGAKDSGGGGRIRRAQPALRRAPRQAGAAPSAPPPAAP